MRNRGELKLSVPRITIDAALDERESRLHRLRRNVLVAILVISFAVVALITYVGWQVAAFESVLAQIRQNGIRCSFAVRTQPMSPRWVVRPIRDRLPQRLAARLIWRTIHSIKVYDRVNLMSMSDALRPLTELEQFVVEKDRATAAIESDDLSELFGAVNVRKLKVDGIQFTTNDMPWLKGSKLERLEIRDCELPASAVAWFPESLEYIDVEQTVITDECLQEFVSLKSLETLSLNCTRLSEAKLQQLRDDMPWCNVRWTHAIESSSLEKE